MIKLTVKQKKVLDFIIEQQQNTGAPPTVREISAHFGYRSPNNARQHLRLIEQKGYIRRVPGKARAIEILARLEAKKKEHIVNIPLVGTVAAGRPITAVENIEGTIALDRNLFKGDDLFSLRIKGDSMKDIGILDGDIAVIRRQASVDDGEIAAVIIEDEATLKRFIRKGGHTILRAGNPAYQDIILKSDREVQIVGKLAGVMRKC